MSKKVQQSKFKLQLFFSLSCFFIGIAVVVSLFFSYTAINNAKKNEVTSSQIILDRVSLQIDSLYEQMNVAATSIIKNNLLNQIVYDLNSLDTNSSKEYMKQLSQKRTIQKTLVNMMFSPIISNVLLYNRNLNYFYYTGLYLNNNQHIDKVLSHNSYDTMLKNNENKTIYKGPHENTWSTYSRNILSVIKNFSDALATQNTVVEIQVPYTVLDDICSQTTFATEKQILILDENYNIAYPFESNDYVLPISKIKEVQKKIKEDKSLEYHSDYTYYSSKSSVTSFTTVLVSNNKTIRAQNLIYIRNTGIAIFFVLIASLSVMFLIISFITKPLKQLIAHINTLELDEKTKLNLPDNTFDEFEVINTSFNLMLERLKQSIAQNYELKIRESNANLAALQAQINPHFLYNTLNSISAASEIYGSEVTSKMCQDFSSMMRYITSKEQIVPLIEEINHTKSYLELMKISNDGNLNYHINISPVMFDLKIPKLTIQPFVENCFKHGFKNCMPPWKINIFAYQETNNIIIIIEDNGQGFSNETLEEIDAFKKTSLLNQTFSYDEIQINGLGLFNTFTRLYTNFNTHFDFTIQNLSPGSRIIMKGELKYASYISS